MKKKLLIALTLILSVSLIAFLLTACKHEHSFGEDNYCKCGEPNWELVYTYENGTITGLTNFGKTLTELKIPETINGENITSIGFLAFEECTSLTSVTIGNSVTSIGDLAFYDCESLTSVVIPNSVTSIGRGAFYYCTSLENINVAEDNENYKSIDGNLYTKDGKTLIQYAIGKSQTAFTIPNSVTSIGVLAFSCCDSLTSVVIPNSVTSIGDATFTNCTSLTSINFAEDNENYKSIDGNLYTKDGKTLIQYAIGKTQTSFTIPNSVTSIGNTAFYGCSSLTSVVIPNSVTSIGDNAFRECDLLTIYCEEESKPNGWSSSWNNSNRPVVWGYKK